ncbi:putative mycothiosynthase [Erwinia phage vB_EamM_RisingSun]|uniref:Putative mycothiosynthase n=1 Tax=Erwinia phage vB_EamM_RisingSun TaxID=2026080 RepID=A0A223LH45_9CAUD|nr:putative mycothiosynthase [Erwinia phage vB_EamM_RisingSun]ASU03544.1 putative mycothiosynthase [Erwinia phage vB_EamM_RisingSun]
MSSLEQMFDKAMNEHTASFNSNLKTINAKGWVNDWVNRHNGKVPINFIPYEEFRAHLTSFFKPGHGHDEAGADVVGLTLFQHLMYNLTKVDIHVEETVIVELMNDTTFDKDEAKIPTEVLKRLPYWSVHIPITRSFNEEVDDPNANYYKFLEVYVSRINIDNDDALLIDINAMYKDKILQHTRVISLNSPTIREGLERHADMNDRLDINKHGDIFDFTLRQVFPVILYVCSQQKQKDIGSSPLTGYSIKRKGKNFVLKAAPKVKVIEYGQELKEQLERFHQLLKQERDFKGRIPHIRKAHWHGYWIGPRVGERDYIYHWIPPVIVSGSEAEIK